MSVSSLTVRLLASLCFAEKLSHVFVFSLGHVLLGIIFDFRLTERSLSSEILTSLPSALNLAFKFQAAKLETWTYVESQCQRSCRTDPNNVVSTDCSATANTI